MGSDYKIDGRDFYSGWDVDSFDKFAKKISNGEMQTPSDKGFGNKCVSFFMDNKGYTEEEAKSACYAGIIRQYKDKQMKESFASDDQQLVQPQGGTQVGQGKLNRHQQRALGLQNKAIAGGDNFQDRITALGDVVNSDKIVGQTMTPEQRRRGGQVTAKINQTPQARLQAKERELRRSGRIKENDSFINKLDNIFFVE